MERRDSAGPRDGARRRFLRYAGAVGATALAGCTSFLGDDDENGDDSAVAGWIGSGPGSSGREPPGGTSMNDMPDLSGELTLYSGRGQVLVSELLTFIEDLYDGFTVVPRYDESAKLVNQIRTEGQNSRADVFLSVNAGSLGALAESGRAVDLPDDLLDLVPREFRDPEGMWVGTSGRARTIPYNTNQFSADEIPKDIYAFPERAAFDDAMGWAPSYGSFQAFVTAMRLLDGEEKTRAWLQGMLDSGVQSYQDEYTIANAIADGEIGAGFANHYYIQRVLADRPDAPLATAFTQGDAGSIFNVAGALVVDTADDADLASNFVRHLLSAEAQEYFATRTFEYPLIPEVEPVGELPTIDELDPPSDLDLSQLADLEPTIRLMRDVGLTV